MRVFTSGEIVSWSSPCGVNCTYTVNFEGPAYDCVDSYDPSLLVGDFDMLFATTEGLVDPPSGFNFTNLTGQYQVSDGIYINRTIANATYLSTHCTLHAAVYTTNVSYTNNIPSITTEVVLNDPILSDVFPYLVQQSFGNTPVDNRTIQLVNFYAIEQAVEGLLNGYLYKAKEGGGITGVSDIQLWNFASYHSNSTPQLQFPDDFSQKIEELLVNTTLSLVYFLENPLPPQSGYAYGGYASAALSKSASATIMTYPTLYSYSASTLWLIYGVALTVSTLCVAFGCFMLFRNGVDADLSFSQVLVTTRNPSLDRLSHGSHLGGATISDDLRKTKLKFGELIGGYEGVRNHVCFGLENEVTQIKRGKVYGVRIDD